MALFIKEQALMTVQKSFAGQTIRYIKLQGEDPFPIINNLLYVTSMSLNVANNLNNFQSMDIVHTIINDYADVKIEELVHIFKQGKKGIYGPHYNKLDIETIIKWINGYFASDEYNGYLENRHKQPEKEVELTEEQKKGWKETYELIKKFLAEKEKEARIVRYTNSAAVVNRVTDQVFAERLESVIPVLSLKELYDWKKEYEKQQYQTGINLIQTEIDKRTHEKQ